MSSPKRNRARILTASGLKKLREQIRSHEVEENAGFKYTLERLGELTGLDPETVKNVLDCKGSDKRTIARCFESFGLTLEDSDHIAAAKVPAAPSDPNFVGRDEAISDLNALVSRNAKVIVIQARGGVGKTTLARKYLQQEFGSFLEFPIAKETKDIASIEGLIEEKLRQLGEEPGREFLVSLDRLKRKLQAERIGILIDNLEPALDAAGKFIEPHRRYVELLRVLSDPTVKSITLITSRERLREVDVTVQHYGLRSLDVKAWEQFFQNRSINAETSALAALHNVYGGNAKAMDIVSGAVLEDFSGDVEAYWQANQDDLFIERDLEDLVTKQFDRLHQLDPDAYKLLYRMGCYRYQDVPTVPIEGLFCLLWDVSENRHRRVIKSLQDRSIIDFDGGEYWLHPVIRAEAVIRLRMTEDWRTSNQKAAEFWTISIKAIETVPDALKALEAYYHYINISDFETAASIILRERGNRWQKAEIFGVSLYRLGLFQRLPSTLNEIVHHIQSNYYLSGIYHLIADSYALRGSLKEAVEFFKRSGEIAEESNIGYFKLASLQNIAVCKMELGDIETAIEYFEKVVKLSEITDSHKHGINARFCLAFLNSCQQNQTAKQKALELAEEVINEISNTDLSIDLTIWGKGYGWLYLGSTYKNLGKSKEALEFYRKAIMFAEECNYPLVKADTLRHLASLYREEQDFETALDYHSQSIRLSEEVGSKADLAEACYQLGLTYYTIGEVIEGQKSFQEAIQLFNEMEAPKQVDKVRQAIQRHNNT